VKASVLRTITSDGIETDKYSIKKPSAVKSGDDYSILSKLPKNTFKNNYEILRLNWNVLIFSLI